MVATARASSRSASVDSRMHPRAMRLIGVEWIMSRWFCLLLPVAAVACASHHPPPRPPEQPKPKSESVAMPEGYVAVHVAGVIPTEDGGAAVLITDEKEQVVLPIMVGGTEALSIQLR